MRHHFLLIALAVPGMAGAAVPAVSDQALYLRARSAEAAGDAARASADLAALLARNPGDAKLAQRALRQAIVAGDIGLALKTARQLDQAGVLPPDGRLLIVIEAFRARDWAGVNAAADRLETERVFGFLAPFVRAWSARAQEQGDPLGWLEKARTAPVARAYHAEQRALMLVAMGKPAEALASLQPPAGPGITGLSGPGRMRLADALAGSAAREEALALLKGDDPAYDAARATIAGGGRLPQARDPAATGLALLLGRAATDFARQHVAPVALLLARLGTYLAPDNGAGWLVTAELLSGLDRPGGALAALDRIAPADPVAALGASLRVAVLATEGDQAQALQVARALAERNGSPLAWSRVGDVELSRDRPREAADAYARALDAVRQAHAPAVTVWRLLLQRAAAEDAVGNWPAAKEALARAYALAPNEPAVLNQYGYAQIARGENVAEASKLIEQASALSPDDPAITDSLGWALYLRGRVADAVPLLEKAAAGAPAESEISEHLGDSYWAAGRRLEARYAWRAALVTADDKARPRIAAKIENGPQPAGVAS
ncbi:hypothetical protein [uncultured Sphingomonas sp.]|uniref:hypothetical protein n=1 Tax=uncultured Sphingomonas sp. TaxID=158754 RepID=UPI0025FF5518|nr:hypothetical protein [uncultured Sphingomonas sp.]